SNNANKSENAKSNEKAKSATKTDDDKDDNKDEFEEVDDPETPRTYIVRFVANVKAADAGKTMIETYNEEVTKENNAARAAAQAEAAKAKNTKTPKGRSANAAANANAKVKLKARGTYKNAFEKVLNAAVIQIPPSAVSGLLRNPRVLSIEPDSTVLVDPTTETQIGATWGLDRLDQRALPLSGTFTSPSNASNVFAYVVDTGIDATHPEFGGRVNTGFDAVSGGSGQTDCNGHGTHVAGTIASQTYGVAKAARLVPVRVLDCNGSGTYSGVIAGLDWIAQNRPSTQRAVVNMSLGGGASSSLDSAVASLVASGVAVVVAAGNSNTDACTTSPARAASAITVGATASNDSRASFSNYGSCLDLFAPGANITSTVPGNSTAIYSGTSMAAPHVAGVAAVALALNAMTPTQLATYLTDNATTGVVGSAGTSSPNLLAYLNGSTGTTPPPTNETPATAPAQPAAPIAEARNKAAIVSWSLPDDGGSAIVSQTIRTFQSGRLVATLRVDGVTTSTRITRLRNGVSYFFTVQATNAVGSSAESASSNLIIPSR
ncbi:MAG: S8 family serine peptidase, partial [Acidimicrobiaceae bacterium]